MYREEFTRQWHKDQFPGQQGNRQLQQYGGNTSSWRDQLTGRTSQYNGHTQGNTNYLSNGVPLPIQRESGLIGPGGRRNPIFNENVETSFNNQNGYARRNLAGSDNYGIDNQGYSGNYGNGWERHPYQTGSVIEQSRNDPVYIYKGKTPSEPGFRSSNWDKSTEALDISYVKGDDYKRQSRSLANSDKNYVVAPSWVRTFDQPIYAEPDKTRRDPELSKTVQKSKTSIGGFIFIRIIIICLVIWDLVNDWLLAASGPIQFLGTSSDNEHRKCSPNKKVLEDTFKLNISDVSVSMCDDTNDIWTLAAVFSLIGSLLAILQVINIVMEIVKRKRPRFFQILQGQSEICFVMFFEELPQCLLFTVYFFMCDCRALNKNINIFSLLASVSATAAITLRYASSLDGISNENGCCNLWWRCCCCRNTDYCCRLHPKECCCTCDMPCPLCCCTLGCNMCRYTPKTWCSSLLKAFSCFCGCCATDDDSYGIRIMNNMSIFILWTCLAFQIVIFHSISM